MSARGKLRLLHWLRTRRHGLHHATRRRKPARLGLASFVCFLAAGGMIPEISRPAGTPDRPGPVEVVAAVRQPPAFQLRRLSANAGGSLTASSASFGAGVSAGQTATGAGLATSFVARLGFWPGVAGPGAPTAVAPGAGGVPRRYALGHNHPNPFNPRTRIGFDLPEATSVVLAIYDVRGRRVRRLVEGRLPAGRYHAVWKGDDDHGSAVASGVYVYELVTPSWQAKRKMALVR